MKYFLPLLIGILFAALGMRLSSKVKGEKITSKGSILEGIKMFLLGFFFGMTSFLMLEKLVLEYELLFYR